MNNKLLLALCALSISGPTTRASAQSFRLDRFRTVEQADDGFGVRRLGDVGHLALGAVLGADYAHDPLVIERRLSNREVQTVVHHELTMQLALSLGLWERVTAFAGLEVIPLLKGPQVPLGFVPEAGGGGMGDLTLGARVRLLGDADDLFALGVQAALLLPTAGDAAYRGEGKVAGLPQIIAELRPSIVRISLNAGALLRDSERIAGAPIGSELVWGAAVGVKVLRPLELLGELHGGFGLRDFGARALTQCEFLLGAKAATRAGFTLGAAAGRGFTGGIGSPDLRVIGQLGYRMPRREPARAAEPAPAPVAPPPPPAPVAIDSDGDGLLDTQDRCPQEPEDFEGVEDDDGCPEPDDLDGDGVLDPVDRCPDQPGVAAEQGCPARATLTEEGSVDIVEQILFATNQAEILPASFPTLEAVAGVLAKHPAILELRIEGHTDDVGAAPKNLILSRERAGAVARWLIAHGVAVSRLEAYGCGEQHPATSAITEEGRAKNRRVLFQVVDPPPSSGPVVPRKGCVKMKSLE